MGLPFIFKSLNLEMNKNDNRKSKISKNKPKTI